MLNDDQRLKLEMTIEGAKENPDALSDWETGFITSTEERYAQYKDATRVSVKQWAAIDRIYDKVCT